MSGRPVEELEDGEDRTVWVTQVRVSSDAGDLAYLVDRAETSRSVNDHIKVGDCDLRQERAAPTSHEPGGQPDPRT